MSSIHRLYLRLIIFLGSAILLSQLLRWQSSDPLEYLCYFILATLAACFHVGFTTDFGTVPLNLLFVLISLWALSPAETFFLAAVATAAAHWRDRQPDQASRLTHILFAVSTVALALVMADYAVHGSFLNGAQRELNSAIRSVFAGVTLFVGISIPWAARGALASSVPMATVWKRQFFWMLPYYIAGSAIAAIFSVASSEIGWQIPVITVPILYLISRSYRLYVARVEGDRSHAEEMASLHLRTIEALAMAIDAKDQTTHDHLARVQIYALEIARELNLSRIELEALRAASLLHDIGKLAVPEHIINKPGRLTPEEFEKMKIHPTVGAEILERVRFPYPVVPIVRSHHEKWDGSGYPDGLKGEEIPIGARILSAVDCLDALSSDRQYRKALPIEKALDIVRKDAGVAFDPQVVDILARRAIELEAQVHALAKTERPAAAPAAPAAGVPAAGYEASGESSNAPDFLNQIAAARHEAQALFEMAQSLGSSLSLDETLSVLSRRLRKLIPYDSMAVYLRRDDLLRPEFVAGDNFRLFSSLEIPVGQGLSGWVAENAKPILNGNPSVEPGYLNDPTRYSTLRSALAVPLEGVNGVIGVVALYHSDRDIFSKDHLRILMVLSSKLSLAVENALRFRQAEVSATTDFLTGLPNARSLFVHLEKEIARCRLAQQPLTVVVCDLDNFKMINDQYGHLEGNKALRIVARTLQDQCREFDYVGRMGGDEFVIILPGLSAEAAPARLHHLHTRAFDEVQLQTGLDLTISMGSATCPADGASSEDLLSAADRAMYRAKEANPNRAKAQRRYDQWLAQNAATPVSGAADYTGKP